MEPINWFILDPPERKRTYYFPGGMKYEFENVSKIEIRPSGKHRLESSDGKKAFVNTGWEVIVIEADEWTV